MKVSEYYETDRYQKEVNEWREKYYYPERLELFIRKLGVEFRGRVLDAGCGDGGLAKEIVNRFPNAQVYGVDISKEGLRLAEKYCVETKIADFNKGIPYPDNYFDFIVSQEVLEHIYDTDRFFEEFHRVLKKGGRAIITTPNLLAWYQRIFALFGTVPTFYELSTQDRSIGLGFVKKILHNTQPVGHIRVFTKFALEDMARLYKFKVISFKGANVRYEFPPILQQLYNLLDFLFSLAPSLASNLVLYIEKK